ncbi:disease resistance protein RPM1-like [Curcuma longa]|uniref:disease resistance protein RPM1-like n=1 Tax=Curcuma longa TaxID=136217 RepID=UPI003D9F705C
MEAAFISFLINKLGEVAVGQAQSTCSQLLLQHTTPPLDQIHARVDRITAEFKVMQAFLEDSNWSTAAATNKALEAWIEQVRVVAFKIEDIIDEYLYLVGRQRERTWKNCCLMAPSDLCFNLAKAWRGIDSRLENMERDLSELSNRRDRFGITISGNEDRVKNSERDTHRYRADAPMLIDEDDLVGIEENRSKLVSWLTNADTCREMTAIAVWGMGGQGKTTLVANVYRNDAVKGHFDCQVWVTVSQTYSVEELLRTMIQEIFKENKNSVPDGITTMLQLELFEIIRENLQQKRYIIVLDDVWHVDLCNDISRAFVDSNNGSRLIVTTRMHEVARMANDEHIIKLQQLDEKDAWILFCKKAFQRGNSKDCPKELEDYTGRILNKCGGSPLAIIAIGSLLSFKEKSETEWKKVHDLLHWEFESNPALDKVKNILNLSFNDLPYYLKNCFVYCSIFPEDYLIKRKKLIRLWVAEGFVTARSSNRSMEEEAEDYLAELVDRSMLQVVQRDASGRLKAIRMHDVVREVTLAISRKAKFSMNILDGSQSVLDNQTRRLSIQTNDGESLDLNTSLRLSRLHSLIVFSTSNYTPRSLRAVLISFKMLRVLELQRVAISKLPNEVSALFNLHYLGLRDSYVRQLPNNIQKLQSLQTLDLGYSRIGKLPRGVTQLKQLRHLLVTWIEVELGGSTVVGCVPTLEGSWQWKNLQTLKGVRLNEELVHRLGDMKELRTLGVLGGWKQAYFPQLWTSLSKMRNLRSLRLYMDASEEQLDFEMLNSSPPPLQKLVLYVRLFEGKMPIPPEPEPQPRLETQPRSEPPIQLPFPQRVACSKKNADSEKTQELQELMDIFSKVEVNIPLLRAIRHIPKYAKFLKELCVHKKKLKGTELVSMGKNVSAMIQPMPQKCKDPGVFTVPCVIGDCSFEDAMLDLGASINVMPKSVFISLGIGPLQPTGVVIQLANRSFAHPAGVIEDVLVKVKDLIFPADFYILDMEKDTTSSSTPLILGRPFLKTARTKIDVVAGHAVIGDPFKLVGVAILERKSAGELASRICIDIKELEKTLTAEKPMQRASCSPLRIASSSWYTTELPALFLCAAATANTTAPMWLRPMHPMPMRSLRTDASQLIEISSHAKDAEKDYGKEDDVPSTAAEEEEDENYASTPSASPKTLNDLIMENIHTSLMVLTVYTSFEEGRLSDIHPSKQSSIEDNSEQHIVVCLERIRKLESMLADLSNKSAEIPLEKDRMLLESWDRIKHIEFDLDKTKQVLHATVTK